MSARQRRQATPDEFASLVQDYYHNKEPYNTLLQAFLNKPFTMPVHPSEENVTGSKSSFSCNPSFRSASHPFLGLTDQVAKDSKDSTASDHSLHDVDTGAKSAPHAKLEDSGSAPVSSEDKKQEKI